MFVAIPLPADASWLEAQAELVKHDWSSAGWRCVLTNPEQWHLTWFFLNRVEHQAISGVQAAVTRTVEQIQSADVDLGFRLAGVGCFAGPIWAAIEFRNQAAAELLRGTRSQIEQLGFKALDNWNPHVTLGRIKVDISAPIAPETVGPASLRRTGREWFEQHNRTSGEWVENPEFVLIESIVSHAGAEHIVRHRWPLVAD